MYLIELVLPPVSSLSYPYTNELVNSIISACVYSTAVSTRDFRNHLLLGTHLRNVAGNAILGGVFRTKAYPGHLLGSVSHDLFSKFDVNTFKSVRNFLRFDLCSVLISDRKRNLQLINKSQEKRYIQRYYPDFISWVKSFFHNDGRRHVESALYRKGQGEQSVFWYWEINHELQYYRDLHTTNLEEGMKIFQEEDFDSWPEYKSTPEWAVRRGWRVQRRL